MCDPGASWTTPVLDSDGKPVNPPHWKCGPVGTKPDRVVTDPAEVVVQVPKVLETFEVSLKRSGHMMVLTRISEKKLAKLMKKHEGQNPGKDIWHVMGGLQFPECSIIMAEKTVPLMEYVA